MILITKNDGKYWQRGTPIGYKDSPPFQVQNADCASAMPQIVKIAPEIWMNFVSFATHVATFSLPVPLRKSGRGGKGGGVGSLPYPRLHPRPH